MLNKKVGVIGIGKMGGALIKGILMRRVILAENIRVYDKNPERLRLILKLGIKKAFNIKQLVRESEIIIIAVKPQDINSAVEEIKSEIQSSHLLISIAAGITSSYLIKKLGKQVPLVRVMPNITVTVGEGISCISPTKKVNSEYIKITKEIFKAVGEVIEVPEEMQDAVTGLSGSGPAYVYTFIKGIALGGIKSGLNEKLAYKLAIQTTLGAAKMAKETPSSLDELRRAVISPGGTTAEGIKVLEKGKVEDYLIGAVIKATQKSKELRK